MSTPAEDLAAALGFGTTPAAEPEPVEQPTPRRPRPDLTQGSGSNGPTDMPAAAQFADWISRMPRGNGSGNWQTIR